MSSRALGHALAFALALPLTAAAQTVSTAAPTDSAAVRILPNELQIAGAVSPAPEAMRAGATVLGYSQDRKLMRIRAGTNDLICLADDPVRPGFHAACYHRSLEPFMARGRALRARGLTADEADTVRLKEIRTRKLSMPTRPTALYQLSAPADSMDMTTGTARGARALHVMYIPYATAKSTGLSVQPIKGPWLMNAGTPWAHIMYTP
ncbi:MAG TPA: hypothetical protein VJ672_06380 [Gemmatimonadaceae bacterium]|nr:hypothetical protein [Gemmatimonadaceae bacterium]